MVKEFEEEYFCRIAIILDTFLPGRPRPEDLSAFEAAISMVASVADHFSRSEYIVDILAAGSTHEPPLEPGVRDLKATHATEIPYVFNNLTAPRVIPDLSSPRLAAASERDRALAEQMSSYWVNFAKTGDPNGKDLPMWLSFQDRKLGAGHVRIPAATSAAASSSQMLAAIDAIPAGGRPWGSRSRPARRG